MIRYYLAILALTFFGITNAQSLDTVALYFNVASDQPLLGTDSEFVRFEKLTSGSKTVVRLEAHCDTTGSMEYNDDLAQRRMDAVVKLLKGKGWIVDHAQKTIHSERMANKATHYDPAVFRRVDIIVQQTTLSDAELLRYELNSFKEDTATSKSIDLKILFFGGQTVMMPESIPEAKELKDFMLANPNIHADIHGHVCCNKNYKLSYNRAKTIAEFLMAQGVDASRLTFEGHSNTQPKVFPERTDEDRKQNRRVVVVFRKE